MADDGAATPWIEYRLMHQKFTVVGYNLVIRCISKTNSKHGRLVSVIILLITTQTIGERSAVF